VELIICPQCGTGNAPNRTPASDLLGQNWRRWGGSGQPCEKCGFNLNRADHHWSHQYRYVRGKGNKLRIVRVDPLLGQKQWGMRGRQGKRKSRKRGYRG
jgi:hypothetical protein